MDKLLLPRSASKFRSVLSEATGESSRVMKWWRGLFRGERAMDDEAAEAKARGRATLRRDSVLLREGTESRASAGAE